MRRLTIGYMYYPDTRQGNTYPKLLIQGRWLQRLGWEIGDKVELQESPTEIVIHKTGSPRTVEPGTCAKDTAVRRVKFQSIQETEESL